ncbi:hypothetical protein SCUP234_12305 [Seiridium cupressi]
MPNSPLPLVKFEKSCCSVSEYPLNLLRTEAWPHELRSFREQLRAFEEPAEDDPMLFDDEYSSIYALDYCEAKKIITEYQLSDQMSDIEQMKQLANITVKDVIYRYIFIHANSSRSPLGCSKEQLLHILTYYQIMTPFIGHVLTFCERDEPYDQATFSSEDRLRPEDELFKIGDLGRSGLQIQHCFNLIGVEHEPKDSWPYLYRQTAVYFSFDPKENRSLCLVLKANDKIRSRIEESTNDTGTGTPLSDPSSRESSFSSTLKTHSLIVEWSIENWSSYITFLEAKVSKISSLIKYTSVDSLTQDHMIHNGISRKPTFQSNTQSKKSTGQLRHFNPDSRSQSWKRMIGVSQKLQAIGNQAKRDNTGPSPGIGVSRKTTMMEDLDIDKIFNFKLLQSLHQQSSTVDKAIMILGQNRSVIHEMVQRFENLSVSEQFNHHVNMGETRINVFLQRSRKCTKELDSQEVKLYALQAQISKDVSLFDAILQFKNMRTGEYFSHAAKVSADKMAELTVRTKQETVSIHVITILTLIFLPGTFVAVRYGFPYLYGVAVWVLTKCQTFFSSNVIDFGSASDVSSFGRWSTNWGALKLFAIVCGPLMAIVLSAWALAPRTIDPTTDRRLASARLESLADGRRILVAQFYRETLIWADEADIVNDASAAHCRAAATAASYNVLMCRKSPKDQSKRIVETVQRSERAPAHSGPIARREMQTTDYE